VTGDRSLRQRLYETLAGVFNVPAEALDDSSSPETIETWDSLNHLNLVMAIETEFGLTLSPEDTLDMRNVALIETILRDRGVDVS
jgi:acyl carrier protein